MIETKYKPGNIVYSIIDKQVIASKVSAVLTFDDNQPRYYITNQYVGTNGTLSYFDIKLNKETSTHKIVIERDIFKTKQELIDSL